MRCLMLAAPHGEKQQAKPLSLLLNPQQVQGIACLKTNNNRTNCLFTHKLNQKPAKIAALSGGSYDCC